MFCPNCGCDCKEAKFCPECGTDLRAFDVNHDTDVVEEEPLNKEIPPLSEPYYCDINGEKVDLHHVYMAIVPVK